MLEKTGSSASKRFGVAFIVGAGTFLSRILGLVREQIFAFYFGAGHSMDAYQIAFRLPNLMKDLFAEGALSASLIPAYAQMQEKRGEQGAWDWLNRFVSVLFLVLAVFSLGVGLFSQIWTGLYAATFKAIPGKFELTVRLMQIMAPFIPLVILAGVWMGILNARRKFGITIFAPSLFNVVSIIAALSICPLLAHYFQVDSIYGMAIAATFGGLLQWLVQAPALRREGYKFRFLFSGIDASVWKVFGTFFLGALGLAATQINVLVNASMAASLEAGTVSWLNYAFRFLQFPIGIFGVALSTSSLVAVAEPMAKGNRDREVIEPLLEGLQMLFFLNHS